MRDQYNRKSENQTRHLPFKKAALKALGAVRMAAALWERREMLRRAYMMHRGRREEGWDDGKCLGGNDEYQGTGRDRRNRWLGCFVLGLDLTHFPGCRFYL